MFFWPGRVCVCACARRGQLVATSTLSECHGGHEDGLELGLWEVPRLPGPGGVCVPGPPLTTLTTLSTAMQARPRVGPSGTHSRGDLVPRPWCHVSHNVRVTALRVCTYTGICSFV